MLQKSADILSNDALSIIQKLLLVLGRAVPVESVPYTIYSAAVIASQEVNL